MTSDWPDRELTVAHNAQVIDPDGEVAALGTVLLARTMFGGRELLGIVAIDRADAGEPDATLEARYGDRLDAAMAELALG